MAFSPLKIYGLWKPCKAPANIIKIRRVNIKEAAKRDKAYACAVEFVRRLYDGKNTARPSILIGNANNARYDIITRNISVIGYEPSSVLVHEIVHSEDHAPGSKLNTALGIQKDEEIAALNKVLNAYIEGRATFAGDLYRDKYHEGTLSRREFIAKSVIDHMARASIWATGTCLALLSWPLMMIGGNPSSLGAIWGTLVLAATAVGTSIKTGDHLKYAWVNLTKYFPFYNSLLRLTKIVGDPIKAFQISSEKIPITWKELLFPSKFYAKEIAQAKLEAEGQ
ncbi:MAG: hypothetical protein NTV88_05270 [Candidatus Micrarchaeota archaeon]|nr:hypothetical protein [Candidatus Micrarchaeota archaeon]